MGITRLGELMRLPRAGLARRLHSALLRDLDIALGKQPAPRRAFVPRERFRERCDFETEIEHVAYLEKALEPLVERCARFLRQRQAGIQALQLRLRHRQEPATRVQLGLASITGEQRRLSDVLGQKLARLTLKAPVRGMELISGSLRGLSAASVDIFAGLTGAAGRDTPPQLLERLRARLGEEAVYGLCLIPEHRPEAAWRPLPQPELLQGPERIETGWWDGKGVARDYYVARHVQGARLWVFQERGSKRWYVHGVFA
jgi:protein ImuB